MRHFQMRILLVVFEQNVETRFVFLDEIRFEDESFDFVVHDDKFQIADAFHQFARLRVVSAVRLEIRANAVFQILRLADVDDFAVGVFVYVNAGRGRQIFEFFFQSHCLNFSAPLRRRKGAGFRLCVPRLFAGNFS